MRDDGTPSDPTIRRLLILVCVLGVLGATYLASCLDTERTTTTDEGAA